MKALAITQAAPQESAVLAACAAAANAEYDYVLKVVIAGQMLREYRENLNVSPSCHSGTTGRFLPKPDSGKFDLFLEENGVARRSAYRWMELADRVVRLGLGINAHRDYAPVIELDGGSITLSQVLLTPEKDLTGLALKFRQGVFGFMEDKTLSEAMRAVADGESAGKRVTLAAGGKAKGGTAGENRKDFPLFIAKHFLAINGNLKGWEKWQKKEPAQYAEVVALMRAFILGGQVRAHHCGAKAMVQGWPRAMRELVADIIKESFRVERDAR